MARPTQDKKDSTIKLRINDDLRNKIEQGAKRKCVSMSEYIRMVIDNHFKQGGE